jgi:hypothetical protein
VADESPRPTATNSLGRRSSFGIESRDRLQGIPDKVVGDPRS